jgi:hypothetical protein
MASVGEIVSTVGAAVGVATTVLTGVAQVSNNPDISQASISAQADIQSKGYELAGKDE